MAGPDDAFRPILLEGGTVDCRGEYERQATRSIKRFSTGWLTANEIRRMEGMPPVALGVEDDPKDYWDWAFDCWLAIGSYLRHDPDVRLTALATLVWGCCELLEAMGR